MPFNSELQAELKKLEWKFGPLIKQNAPEHPGEDLHMMKEIVKGLAMDGSIDATETLMRFLEVIDLEKWQLLLAYAWAELLGPIECRLWTKAGELNLLCTTKGQGTEESKGYAARASAYQSSAFTTPPAFEASRNARYESAVDGPVWREEPSFGLVEDSPVFPSFDVVNSGMGSKDLLKYVVGVLAAVHKKRGFAEQIEKALGTWGAEIKRRDSASA